MSHSYRHLPRCASWDMGFTSSTSWHDSAPCSELACGLPEVVGRKHRAQELRIRVNRMKLPLFGHSDLCKMAVSYGLFDLYAGNCYFILPQEAKLSSDEMWTKSTRRPKSVSLTTGQVDVKRSRRETSAAATHTSHYCFREEDGEG